MPVPCELLLNDKNALIYHSISLILIRIKITENDLSRVCKAVSLEICVSANLAKFLDSHEVI